ncbi:hypothetical protein [Cryobacterium zhongshanensis]|uniref:Uncharacterized protein n=1 Tax=Cryobacterium zhongshanensis TaxID=2928153 RepID=A0AA41QY42_9MICO|nr:hypothetical protein [Cryobacterium zhongshanensis]MCI4659607.1 hypothetical protein [Cryobacterium zhongshanensis]
MAEAVLNGYAQSAETIYQLRPASILHFSDRGLADCSAFIDLAVPAGNPDPNEHFGALQNYLAGDKAEWLGLLKQAKTQRRVDKGVLAERLHEYRDAVLAKTPLPPVNPWAATRPLIDRKEIRR